ncbi:MAG: STAS domain-containing protein [Chitinivibrionales bacterium]|nr:STAS domain-containing protein [Chitinivibrionales bacterium]MBD3356552.1 STAS domain-containing protein [Chitinivibrionales bacterium]
MRSEALDITIESRGNTIWLFLSGPFHSEQVPNIREKIEGFIEDGHRALVVDLEAVTEINEGVVPLFLDMLNMVKGKGGDLRLVFSNEAVSTAFARYRNLFAIFPNARAVYSHGFWNNIRRRGILLSRRTGVRLSRPVAVFLLFVLCGWFFSLALIIRIQNRLIRKQEEEIRTLITWKHENQIEIERLRERLRPLRQLGLLRDTIPESPE